jgi:hypothetical protein
MEQNAGEDRAGRKHEFVDNHLFQMLDIFRLVATERLN